MVWARAAVVMALSGCVSGQFGPVGQGPGSGQGDAVDDRAGADGTDPTPPESASEEEGAGSGAGADPDLGDPAAPDPGMQDEAGDAPGGSGAVGFHFVYGGDSRNDHEAAAATSRSMAAIDGIQLAVSGGDVTDGDPLEEVATAFTPLFAANIPVIVAQGNHDDSGSEYLDFLNEYLGMPVQTTWWAYDAAPGVRFLMLDSIGGFDEGSDQYDWFVAEVQACAAEGLLCFPVNHHGHLNSEKDNADEADGRALYTFAAAQPRSVVPFILSSHSHNAEVLAFEGMPEIVSGGWGTDSCLTRTMANDEVNPESSCMGVSQVFNFFELEVVSAQEIVVTLRKQNGELMTPEDGLQPIPNDRIGRFSVRLDEPFRCP